MLTKTEMFNKVKDMALWVDAEVLYDKELLEDKEHMLMMIILEQKKTIENLSATRWQNVR